MDDDAKMRGNGFRGRVGRGRGQQRGVLRGRGGNGGQQQQQQQRPSLKRGGGPGTTRFIRGGRGRGRVMRGGASQRQDTDGDSSMIDTEITFNRRDQNFGSWISVRGYEDGVSLPDIVQFLISKSEINPTPVAVESVMEGRRAYILFENAGIAMRIKKLSGIRMGGGKLFIEFSNYKTTMGEGKQGWVSILGEFLTAHYNKEGKFINLANMAGQSHGNINFDFNQVGFVRALFQAIANKFPDVTTINFSNDKIRTLQGFFHLPKYTTSIVNLSFDANEIEDFNELDHLKELKLRELALTNNPIKLSGEAKYQSEITKRFPSLKYLDGAKVEPLINFGLPNYITSGSLPPIRGSWYDSPDTQRLAEQFLSKYFEIYDSGKRDGLLDVYIDSSIMSICANFFVKKENRTQRMAQDQGATAYKSQSRNLMFIKDTAKRVSTLQQGRINIIHLLNTLPPTRHHFEDVRVDAFIMKELGPSPLCCINMHGSFWETTTQVNRSFDRTFLLTPAPPNSTAASQGFPALILNDQVHVRYHGAPLPAIQQPNQPNQVAPQPAPIVPSFTPPVMLNPITTPPMQTQPLQLLPQPETGKQQLVDKLRFVTKLKPEFAQQALEHNNWVYEKALEAFYALQANNQISPNMLDI